MIALLNNIEMGYDEGGAGVPVIFVHGFPHDRTLWTPQLQGLTVQARCFAVDLRGLGETTAAAPYSVDQYADDLAGFMDVLHIERAVIAGLSMGGNGSWYLAYHHGDRFAAALVICGWVGERGSASASVAFPGIAPPSGMIHISTCGTAR